jgi:acetyl-CoA carboxylase biotin carboxyl carrier protein
LSEKKNVKKSSRPAGAVSGSPMDVGLLQRIVDLMAVNDLNTVDVREGDKRIIIKRGAQNVMVAPMPVAAAPAPAAVSAKAAAAAAAAEDEAKLKAITSPMVGTFYAAPSPDAKPFVNVGSVVDEDTDVCIIEAMKVFNNIKAETRGTIVKILVENGQSVEFGQTLFMVKPS